MGMFKDFLNKQEKKAAMGILKDLQAHDVNYKDIRFGKVIKPSASSNKKDKENINNYNTIIKRHYR
jgi:hypothetical protein